VGRKALGTHGRKILLGQLGARGDCLYATAVARQIKVDYPGCRLTWAIGSMCRAILEENPFVDDIWEIPMRDHGEMASAWRTFYPEALRRKRAGDFDLAFFTQIYPDNYGNFDGTVRASIFRGYPRPITVPVTPVLRLRPDEVANVSRFTERSGLLESEQVILFEFSGSSAQTFIDQGFAITAADAITSMMPNCVVVFASHMKASASNPRVIDASSLTFREIAELSKYCSLLVGCSSGISWLCTSDWAKRLPTIQLLSASTSVYASTVHDHEHFGLPTGSIIEITDCPPTHVADCVVAIYGRGFGAAKESFHEAIPLNFDNYFRVLESEIQRKRYRQIAKSLYNAVRRYGLHPQLRSFMATQAARFLRRLL
jgi:hypothetical protein